MHATTIPVVMDQFPEVNKIFRGWSVMVRTSGRDDRIYAITTRVDGKSKRVRNVHFKDAAPDAAIARAEELKKEFPDKDIVVRENRIEGFVF